MAPGLPKQFDCDKVLEKSIEVFWAKGFEATSMQDLVNAMGINRASMYDTFGGKRQLFELAFTRYCQQAADFFESLLNREGSPMENLRDLLRQFSSQSAEGKNFGCFINNVAIEFGPHDERLAKMVRDVWEEIERLLGQHIERAIAQGEIDTKADIINLARLINTVIQGMVAKSKVSVELEDNHAAIEQLILLITGSKPASPKA